MRRESEEYQRLMTEKADQERRYAEDLKEESELIDNYDYDGERTTICDICEGTIIEDGSCYQCGYPDSYPSGD